LRKMDAPLLSALAELRDQIRSALTSSIASPEAGQQPQLLRRFRVLSQLVMTCQTDEEAQEALRGRGRRTDELSWVAQQLRGTMRDSCSGAARRAGRQGQRPEDLEASPSPSSAWPTTTRHLPTTLAFDSALQPGFVGMRSTTRAARRMLFEADGYELDLEMSVDPVSQRMRLVGQITAHDAAAGDGWLRVSRAYDQWLVMIDESGEFGLDGLERGTYRLEVTFKDRVVEVPSLEI
jgi:hypothetical protein